MSINQFDKYFLNLPPINRADDFKKFWDNAVNDLKKIPIEPKKIQNSKKSSSSFSVHDISFKGFMKSPVYGELLLPVGKKKPSLVIFIHDYNTLPKIAHKDLDPAMAYFFPLLRGHNIITETESGEQESPGYLTENILNKETYYVKAVFLDILRSIDMLRLEGSVDCNNIGIIGKGLGAAASVFAAYSSNRVSAVVLDTPSFCNIELSQNISTGCAAGEINSFIQATKRKKKEIKNNLSYFDSINFADSVKCPVLTTVGFKDTISPPECVFALFNHLLCEKTMEVYPDDGNTAGGINQFKKSISWLTSNTGK